MDDSEMIERVAKAIYEARYPQYEWEHCKAAATRPVDRAAKKEVAETLGAARAAIEARKPPEGTMQMLSDKLTEVCKTVKSGPLNYSVDGDKMGEFLTIVGDLLYPTEALSPSLKEQEEGN
jgi:hypothetical protein